MSLASNLIKHNPKIFRSRFDTLIYESLLWAQESGGKISIAQIANYNGISERTVKRRISIFKMLGLVQADSVKHRVNCYRIVPDSEIDIRFLPDETIERIDKSYKNCQQVTPVSPCNNTKNKLKSNPMYNKQVIGDYSQYFEGPGPFWDYQESDFHPDECCDDVLIEREHEITTPEPTESPRIEKSRKDAISECLLTEKGVKAGFRESHVIQLCQWRFIECTIEYLTLTIKYFLEDLDHPNCQIVDPIRYLFRVLGNRSVYVSQAWKWEEDDRRRREKEELEKEWENYWAGEREKRRIEQAEREKIPLEIRNQEAIEEIRRQQEGFTELLMIAKRAAGVA